MRSQSPDQHRRRPGRGTARSAVLRAADAQPLLVEPAGLHSWLDVMDREHNLHTLFTPDQDIATIIEELTTLTNSEP